MERLRYILRAATIIAAAGLGVISDNPTSVLAASCQYRPGSGFAQAVALNPDIPDCMDNEHKNNITGRMEQNTLSNGRLEWDGVNIIFTPNTSKKDVSRIINLNPSAAQQPNLAQPSNQCTTEGSFNYFEVARPDIVGRCLENAHPDANASGDTIQETTKGELRLKGGITYFANGNLTYVLGNRAIYQRANDISCPGEPGATPSALACQEIKLYMNHIYTQENVLALTFDDGTSKEAIQAMGEAIISTGNSAVFFINGRYYRAYRDLILQLDQSGQIFWANHTDNHLDIGALANNGAWGQINSEILNGDPLKNIPELKHATPFFRSPGFSYGAPTPVNSELLRRLVFQYDLTVVDSDQGDYDFRDVPQSYIDERITSGQSGQVEYGHLLLRNIPTFKNDLIILNQKGLKGADLSSMLDRSRVRTILPKAA